ncbi:MAG: hypothetical protein K8T26_12030 [Lentisphaerae bacterium]|nr:hypothetical protein [Lentisphaerota bacterium]
MRLFSKEATRYAVLLICMFGIAAIAVWHVLGYLGDRLETHDYAVASILICVITFGFMLIAGAFGLWGIQLAAAAEGRRRVARLIEAMDYIQDGLIAIDRRGRVTGSNPAIKRITGSEVEPNQPLQAAFACLNEHDVAAFLAAADPDEIERKLFLPTGVRTLRFRSQPIEGMILLLVSDVTRMEVLRLHNRFVARLQLIGQIARGVAFDFNNLLCAIAGHAALLTRLPADSPEVPRSIRAISKGAERGTTLAAHLLELSMPVPSTAFPRMSVEYLQVAISSLRDSLSEAWQIDAKVTAVPPMSLTGIKIEQVILNLGLLVADRAATPGTLRVVVSSPRDDDPLLNVGPQFAGILLVAATPLDVVAQPDVIRDDAGSSGVIVSVIRTMIEQASGTLECFRGSDGSPIYRVALPHETTLVADSSHPGYAAELAPYIANWRVLVLTPQGERHHRIQEYLRNYSVNVEVMDNIVSALARMENKRQLDALIIDQRVIPMEAKGLLRAVMKLCPAAALVVLNAEPGTEEAALAAEVVFVRYTDPEDQLLRALVEARSLAMKRRVA